MAALAVVPACGSQAAPSDDPKTTSGGDDDTSITLTEAELTDPSKVIELI